MGSHTRSEHNKQSPVIGNRDAVNWKGNPTPTPRPAHRHFPQGRTALVSLLLCHTSAYSICYKSPPCQRSTRTPSQALWMLGITTAQRYQQEAVTPFRKVEFQVEVQGAGGVPGSAAQRLSSCWGSHTYLPNSRACRSSPRSHHTGRTHYFR